MFTESSLVQGPVNERPSRFAEKVLEHSRFPSNRQEMKDADVIGEARFQGRGPRVTLYLKIEESTIAAATFTAEGCGVTVACASILTEMVSGKSLNDCVHYNTEDLITAAGGLPADKRYCAEVTMLAFKNALAKISGTASNDRN